MDNQLFLRAYTALRNDMYVYDEIKKNSPHEDWKLIDNILTWGYTLEEALEDYKDLIKEIENKIIKKDPDRLPNGYEKNLQILINYKDL